MSQEESKSKLQKFLNNPNIPEDLKVHLSIGKLFELIDVLESKSYTSFIFHKRDINIFIVLSNIEGPLTTSSALAYIKEIPSFNKKIFSLIESKSNNPEQINHIYTIYNILNEKDLAIPNVNITQLATKYFNTYNSVKNRKNSLSGYIVISDHYVIHIAVKLIMNVHKHSTYKKRSETYKVIPVIEKWAEEDISKIFSPIDDNLFLKVMKKFKLSS